MEHVLDAQGKRLGRVATEAAKLLMGKNRVDFVRNTIPDIKVKIINTSKADILNRKLDGKVYTSYSGYPGGLKQNSMRKVVGDKGYKEAFRKAVYGMLPTNKLRAQMMLNLIITE